VIVTEAIRSSYVEKELALAIDMRKPVIPLVFDDFWDADEPLARRLRTFQAIDFRQSPGRGDRETALLSAITAFHLAPVMAVYSPKGGVGKTTISAHLAAFYFKRCKRDVLLIDMDPQANLSTLLVRPRPRPQPERLGRRREQVQLVDVLASMRQLDKSVWGLLEACATPQAFLDDSGAAQDFINRLDEEAGRKWDIVVGDKRIADWVLGERNAAKWGNARRGFGRFVERCRRRYDCVIIDMNPSVSDLTTLALGAATDVVSPVKPDIYSLQSLDLLEEISMEQLDEANGLGRVIVINEPSRDRERLVRKEISRTSFSDRLSDHEFVDSREFYASPATNLATDLSWLPAYGNWGPTPSAARRALQAVGVDLARRTGMRLP
jgi:chromosome partitioning protein